MSDIDLQVALMEAGRMNLMHLPPGAISWLWDRPAKQVDAAESLATAANAHGNPVVDASLLKADQNILLIKCEGGECFRIYPDGGFSFEDAPMDIGGCSSVLQGQMQGDCPMDDNGHQMPPEAMVPETMGNDEHMDAMPPVPGVASPEGMTNLAGEPTMDEDLGGGTEVAGTYTLSTDDSEAGGIVHVRDVSDMVQAIREYGGAVTPEELMGAMDNNGNISITKVIRPGQDLPQAMSVGHRPYPVTFHLERTDDAMGEDQGGDMGGPGATAMGGMGTGTPYVGDTDMYNDATMGPSMDANDELENQMMSRELGEATIHMFRDDDDESLDDMLKVLGLTEMDDWDERQERQDAMRSDAYGAPSGPAPQAHVEVYDPVTNSMQEATINISWDIQPTEYDGPHVFAQGGATVEDMKLAEPIQVNGKTFAKLDNELAALIMATLHQDEVDPSPQAWESLRQHIEDREGADVDVPTQRYPDSRGS